MKKCLKKHINIEKKKSDITGFSFFGAFTLAEVLITLGIIGVVAALTLPLLITNVQARIRTARIENIEQKLNQATDEMNSIEGVAPYESTEEFVNILQKHLKLAKVCKADNIRACWPYQNVDLGDGIQWDIAKTLTGAQLKMPDDDYNDYKSDNVGFITADGVAWIVNYNKKCDNFDQSKNGPQTTTCVAGIFDWNGASKPNKFGIDATNAKSKDNTDVIAFHAHGLGSKCALSYQGRCWGSAFAPLPMSYADCLAQKSKLGIWQCQADPDYWAGAVKSCGGTNNMPKIADLSNLKDYLYANGTFDSSKAAFIDSNAHFRLWSDHQFTATHAYQRDFGGTVSNTGGTYQGTSSVEAICIGDL